MEGCPMRCGIQSLMDLDLPQLVSTCISIPCVCFCDGRVIGLPPLDVYMNHEMQDLTISKS